MIFDKTFGIKEYNGTEMNRRTSVKIIGQVKNKYLMLLTNNGDLEFPGGKIEKDESRKAAVKRELLEETGYRVSGAINYLGKIISRREDRFDSKKLYEATMYFYKCQVVHQTDQLILSESEMKFDYLPILLKKEAIINKNKTDGLTPTYENVLSQITTYLFNSVDESILTD